MLVNSYAVQSLLTAVPFSFSPVTRPSAVLCLAAGVCSEIARYSLDCNYKSNRISDAVALAGMGFSVLLCSSKVSGDMKIRLVFVGSFLMLFPAQIILESLSKGICYDRDVFLIPERI